MPSGGARSKRTCDMKCYTRCSPCDNILQSENVKVCCVPKASDSYWLQVHTCTLHCHGYSSYTSDHINVQPQACQRCAALCVCQGLLHCCTSQGLCVCVGVPRTAALLLCSLSLSLSLCACVCAKHCCTAAQVRDCVCVRECMLSVGVLAPSSQQLTTAALSSRHTTLIPR